MELHDCQLHGKHEGLERNNKAEVNRNQTRGIRRLEDWRRDKSENVIGIRTKEYQRNWNWIGGEEQNSI